MDTGGSNNQKGSALVYILIAIALLAALTITFMEPSSQQTSSQNTFRTVATLQSQIDLIRSALQQCVLSYPRGDDNIDSDPGGEDEGATTNYPINPASRFYSGSTDGPSDGRLARDLRCPGDKIGPLENDHALIFGGRSGKFMPPPPDLFEDWRYYNGRDGIFFWTSTNKTDSHLRSAMDKLNENFALCELDLIDARSSAVSLTSDNLGELTCSSGSMCVRVWVISKDGAIFPDEKECQG